MAELLVGVSLLVISLSAIYGVLFSGYNSYVVGEKQISSQVSGRLAMEWMIKEIRQAKEAETGAFAIEEANPQSLIFYADVESQAGCERIRYFLDRNTLKRGVTFAAGDPPSYPSSSETINVLAKDVDNVSPIFIYFDQDCLPLSDPVNPVNVSLVRIRLRIDDDPNEIPEALILESNVQIRSLKTNLGD